MKMTFEVVIETNKAEPEDLAAAIQKAIYMIELPDGRSVLLGPISVKVKDVVPNK